MAEQGFVKKCSVNSCGWWKNDDCMAPAITVDRGPENGDCDTWLPKE
ncbi:MAG: DUF1540 domain-containing protein [Actinobacteria bacterium]|nr:MAG: DUF1540 domain-containing protein [Actinomycetota bacterium]